MRDRDCERAGRSGSRRPMLGDGLRFAGVVEPLLSSWWLGTVEIDRSDVGDERTAR